MEKTHYAVVRECGRQYRLTEGERVLLEKQDVKPGDEIRFTDILLYAEGKDVRVGKPTVPGVTVTAKVEGNIRGEKCRTLKWRRREMEQRRKNHKQTYTAVTVTKIEAT